MTHIDTSKEAVERLLDGVTPGPWEVVAPSDDIWPPRVFAGSKIICMVDNSDLTHAKKMVLARFIADARDLVPALRAIAGGDA